MEEKVQIKLGRKYFINHFGLPLILIAIILFVIFIYGAWFENMTWLQTLMFIIGDIFILILGVTIIKFRNFKNATLHFIPEGIIIHSKIGFIPLKYKEIKYFKSINITNQDGTKEFVIETKDAREFVIKSKTDIYDGLINVFPNKDGTYMD